MSDRPARRSLQKYPIIFSFRYAVFTRFYEKNKSHVKKNVSFFRKYSRFSYTNRELPRSVLHILRRLFNETGGRVSLKILPPRVIPPSKKCLFHTPNTDFLKAARIRTKKTDSHRFRTAKSKKVRLVSHQDNCAQHSQTPLIADRVRTKKPDSHQNSRHPDKEVRLISHQPRSKQQSQTCNNAEIPLCHKRRTQYPFP